MKATGSRLAAIAAALLLLGITTVGPNVPPAMASEDNCCGGGGGNMGGGGTGGGKTDAERAIEDQIRQQKSRETLGGVYGGSGTGGSGTIGGGGVPLPRGNVNRQQDSEGQSQQIRQIGDVIRQQKEREETESAAAEAKRKAEEERKAEEARLLQGWREQARKLIDTIEDPEKGWLTSPSESRRAFYEKF